MDDSGAVAEDRARARDDRVGQGIACILFAMFAMSMMDGMAKWLGQGYSPVQIAFFRGLFALIPVLMIVWQSGGINALRTRHPLGHLFRAATTWLALVCFFAAIRSMPLADAVAIAFAAPLFVTALSVPFLGESVGPRRWLAVIVGFIGVLVMVRPGAGAFQPEALLVLLAALGYALAMLVTRRLTRTETNAAILFYSTAGATLANGLLLPFFWVTPTAGDLGLFAGLGLIGGVGSFFMVLAYRHAPAAVIAPFDYTALLWATLLGWLVWQELPDAPVWFGAAIVVLSGLYIIHREAGLGRRRNTS